MSHSQPNPLMRILSLSTALLCLFLLYGKPPAAFAFVGPEILNLLLIALIAWTGYRLYRALDRHQNKS